MFLLFRVWGVWLRDTAIEEISSEQGAREDVTQGPSPSRVAPREVRARSRSPRRARLRRPDAHAVPSPAPPLRLPLRVKYLHVQRCFDMMNEIRDSGWRAWVPAAGQTDHHHAACAIPQKPICHAEEVPPVIRFIARNRLGEIYLDFQQRACNSSHEPAANYILSFKSCEGSPGLHPNQVAIFQLASGGDR